MTDGGTKEEWRKEEREDGGSKEEWRKERKKEGTDAPHRADKC